MNQRARGFTIVELLIVIVIIAILAAITVVAFNGIQQRAQNTQTVSALNYYLKAFKLYAADNGSVATIANNGYYCIGNNDSYPADSSQPNNGTGQCGTMGGRTISTSSVVMERLKPYVSDSIVFKPSKVWYQELRGIMATTYSGGAQVIYILEGNVSCMAGFSKNYFGNTYCLTHLSDDGSIK